MNIGKIERIAPAPNAKLAREPQRPEELVGALHDRVHSEIASSRPAKSVRTRGGGDRVTTTDSSTAAGYQVVIHYTLTTKVLADGVRSLAAAKRIATRAHRPGLRMEIRFDESPMLWATQKIWRWLIWFRY